MTLIKGRTLYLSQLFLGVSVYLDQKTLTSHGITIRIFVHFYRERIAWCIYFSWKMQDLAHYQNHLQPCAFTGIILMFSSVPRIIQTNKLACLVRDALCLEYIRVVVPLIAVIGVQLVARYYAMTISNKSTHSSLKLFFENLYEELCNHQVNETFFSLTSPDFKSVSDKLFQEV